MKFEVSRNLGPGRRYTVRVVDLFGAALLDDFDYRQKEDNGLARNLCMEHSLMYGYRIMCVSSHAFARLKMAIVRLGVARGGRQRRGQCCH